MSNDWEAPQESSGGIYLNLKTKGAIANIRIIGSPYMYNDHSDKYGTRRMAGFKVLSFSKDADGNVVKEAKVFKATPMVYKLIWGLLKDHDFGPVGQYNIKIERTEETGQYYTVKPLGIKPLSESELKIVDDADIDLVKACTPKSKPAQTPEPEYDPFQED